jgi:predicted ATPase
LEVFGRTVDRIKALPVLLIVTFRPEFNAPWVGQSHVTSMALNRLGEREAAAIITRLVGNACAHSRASRPFQPNHHSHKYD